MVTEIIEQGERRLALSLGTGAASRSLARITSLLKDSGGWLVRGREAQTWRFEGFSERNGTLFLYGPHHPGRTLGSVMEAGLAEALPFIETLVSALLILEERDALPDTLQTDSVFFTGDGAVLFFPPDVMREVRGIRTFGENKESFEVFNHPDLRGERRLSFCIAALLYRISTGSLPFDGSGAEEIHEEERKREVPAPDLMVPGLLPRFSSTVMESLSGEARGSVKLSRWLECVGEWRKQPLVRELTPEEKQRISREKEAGRRKLDRRYRRKIFWERNKKIVAISAAAAVLAGVLAGSIMKNVLAPHLTRGFSPEKVVKTFYLSMNTLDHVAMSACVTGNAGKAEIDETLNLYVISRVNMAYGGKPAIVDAAAWDKNGRPALDPMSRVFGVTDLTLTPENGEPDPRFLATYEMWTPTPQQDAASAAPKGPSFEGEKITDRVSLRWERDYWVIFRIERLKTQALGPVR